MKRPLAAVAGVLGALTLAGCAVADEQATPDAYQDWMTQQNEVAAENPRTLSSSAALTGDDEMLNTGEGVTAHFGQGATVAEIAYACTGADAVSFEVEVRMESTSSTYEMRDLPCGDEPTTFDLPEFTGVTDVRVNGVSTKDGAWSVVLLGPA